MLRSSYIPRHRSLVTKPESPLEYCMDLVRKHDHENFLCSLLLPKEIRNTAFAVRAFNIEVANVTEHAKEKHTAQMRMSFWDETLENIFKGSPPKHPVALALSRAVADHKLLKKQFTRLIRARSNLMKTTSFPSLEAMEAYCEETVSPIYYLLLQANGLKEVGADHAASHLGKAQGLSNLLRSVPYNSKRREVLLPLDLLAKHGVSEESLIRGATSLQMKDLFFEIASSAKIHLDKSIHLRESVDKSVWPCYLPTIAVKSFLQRLREVDFDLFSPLLYNRNVNLGWTLLWRKISKNY